MDKKHDLDKQPIFLISEKDLELLLSSSTATREDILIYLNAKIKHGYNEGREVGKTEGLEARY